MVSHTFSDSGHGSIGIIYLYWLVVWNHGILNDFPFSWEFHHPNWQTPSFFRGVETQPPTSHHKSSIYHRNIGSVHEIWLLQWIIHSYKRNCPDYESSIYKSSIYNKWSIQLLGLPPTNLWQFCQLMASWLWSQINVYPWKCPTKPRGFVSWCLSYLGGFTPNIIQHHCFLN